MRYWQIVNPSYISAALLYTVISIPSTVRAASGYTSACGRTPIEPRLNASQQIETARPYSWPWVATICGNSRYYGAGCHATPATMGTVIGSRWVLTIYQQIEGITTQPALSVRTGVYNLHSNSM